MRLESEEKAQSALVQFARRASRGLFLLVWARSEDGHGYCCPLDQI